MAYLDDISRFGYGNNYANVGVVPTPVTMGISDFGSGAGASNPVGSYFQAAASSPSVPSGSPGAFSSMIGFGKDIFPNAPGGSGSGFGGLGMNLDTAKLALGGLQTIGSLWQAWEANKLAKQQLNFQKQAFDTNLTNQIASYNTSLEDRTRARAFTEGMSADDAQAYIDAHKLRKQ